MAIIYKFKKGERLKIGKEIVIEVGRDNRTDNVVLWIDAPPSAKITMGDGGDAIVIDRKRFWEASQRAKQKAMPLEGQTIADLKLTNYIGELAEELGFDEAAA